MSIVINQAAFEEAAKSMQDLYEENKALRNKLATLYESVTKALDTPVGEKLQWTSTENLLAPLDDMSDILEYISDTLSLIIGNSYIKGEYYDKVFEKYRDLKSSVNTSNQC